MEGRIDRSNINDECMHALILPKERQMSRLIALCCHQNTGHATRSMTLSQICTSVFWIVNVNSVTCSTIHNCMTYRSLRGRIANQKRQNCLSVPRGRSCTITTLPADLWCRLDDLAATFTSSKPRGWLLEEAD